MFSKGHHNSGGPMTDLQKQSQGFSFSFFSVLIYAPY